MTDWDGLILTGKRNRTTRYTDEQLRGDKSLYVRNDNEEPPRKRQKVTPTGAVTRRVGARPLNNRLHLYFVAMGQGDCTILVTPTNDVFIIDIGSSEWEYQIPFEDETQNLQNILSQPNILGLNSRVRGLILTHSDADHHNKLAVLRRLGGYVDKVYHSNLLAQFGVRTGNEIGTMTAPAAGADPVPYHVSGLSYTSSQAVPAPCPDFNALNGFIQTPQLIQDNAYAPVQQYRAYCDSRRMQAPPVNFPEGNVGDNLPYWSAANGFVIYDEGGCRISLLVANYRNYANAYDLASPNRDDAPTAAQRQRVWQQGYQTNTTENITIARRAGEDANRASIIVHIRYVWPDNNGGGEENYVISGDATREPLEMVCREYNLRDVTILQAPHHGSGSNGSDSEIFFGRMAPQIAVYSSPYKSDRHGHPRIASIERMQNAMVQNDEFLSSYGAWRGTEADQAENPDEPRVRTYTQYINIPYRIYVTGWMPTGCYHYIAPIDTDGNHPVVFRGTMAGETVQDGLPPPPPVIVPPPVEGGGGVPIVED